MDRSALTAAIRSVGSRRVQRGSPGGVVARTARWSRVGATTQRTAARSDMIPSRRDASLMRSSGSARRRPGPARSTGVVPGGGGPIRLGVAMFSMLNGFPEGLRSGGGAQDTPHGIAEPAPVLGGESDNRLLYVRRTLAKRAGDFEGLNS